MRQSLSLNRFRLSTAVMATAVLALAAAPSSFAQQNATTTLPNVGGDVNITVKTGMVTTRSSDDTGARATNCIGSVTSGSVAGDVHIVVNGQQKSAADGCVTTQGNAPKDNK